MYIRNLGGGGPDLRRVVMPEQMLGPGHNLIEIREGLTTRIGKACFWEMIRGEANGGAGSIP